jgi:hypothetical protein
VPSTYGLITRLRRKIEFDPAHPNAIRTVIRGCRIHVRSADALYQNSKTLTHATCAATGTSIAKMYGGPMGYGRLARARTMSQMSQCLRSLVLVMCRNLVPRGWPELIFETELGRSGRSALAMMLSRRARSANIADHTARLVAFSSRAAKTSRGSPRHAGAAVNLKLPFDPDHSVGANHSHCRRRERAN